MYLCKQGLIIPLHHLNQLCKWGKFAISPANIFHKCSQDELGPISFITQHIKSAAIYLLQTCAHVEAYQ